MVTQIERVSKNMAVLCFCHLSALLTGGGGVKMSLTDDKIDATSSENGHLTTRKTN